MDAFLFGLASIVTYSSNNPLYPSPFLFATYSPHFHRPYHGKIWIKGFFTKRVGVIAMEQKGFLPCNGAELFYETAGSGEPLVLIHGAPLDSRMWEPQMKVLSERYQVVRFDMRGMGQSFRASTARMYERSVPT